MNTRLKKTRELFATYKIDALVVTDDINARYLSQFPASESWLLITPKKAYYITDFRYIQEVKQGLSGFTPLMYRRSFYSTLFDLVSKHGIKNLGINEQHWTVARYKALKKECPRGVKLRAANDLVESLREIKQPHEVQLIRQGLELHQKALKYIKKYIKPSNTEEAILEKLEAFVRRHKVSFSFPPIIASGPNSSYPHAHVTTRKIRNNEPVMVDMGVVNQGYKTDLTRMFFLGKISNLVQEITATCARSAASSHCGIIRPGVSIAEVDLKARKYLESKNLAKYFGHSLGHGVGLEIHEGPRLYHTIRRPVLKAGMIITVEPAVYLAESIRCPVGRNGTSNGRQDVRF